MQNNITISDPAKQRIYEIMQTRNNNSFLRVSIQSGGCAGFQSSFAVEDKLEEDDIEIKTTYEGKELKVVVDETSLELINGSTVEFTNNIMGSYFWLNVPNAESKCGCGSSFSL